MLGIALRALVSAASTAWLRHLWAASGSRYRASRSGSKYQVLDTSILDTSIPASEARSHQRCE
jgi:hypothetical protein